MNTKLTAYCPIPQINIRQVVTSTSVEECLYTKPQPICQPDSKTENNQPTLYSNHEVILSFPLLVIIRFSRPYAKTKR